MNTMAEIKIPRLNSAEPDFSSKLAELLAWGESEDAAIQQRVQEIIGRVRKEGDAAVLEYTHRFDRYAATVSTLRITMTTLPLISRGSSLLIIIGAMVGLAGCSR